MIYYKMEGDQISIYNFHATPYLIWIYWISGSRIWIYWIRGLLDWDFQCARILLPVLYWLFTYIVKLITYNLHWLSPPASCLFCIGCLRIT
jgi:hypothetical protein